MQLASAEASHCGCRNLRAHAVGFVFAAAADAICTKVAASGTGIMAAIATIGLARPSESRRRHQAAERRQHADGAHDSVAAIVVMMSVSRWRTWLSSWAITPVISSRLR